VQFCSINIALVTTPDSWPEIFDEVLEWKVPSSVTPHLIVAPMKPSSLRLAALQAARQCNMFVASLVPEAGPVAAARIATATVAVKSWMILLRMPSSFSSDRFGATRGCAGDERQSHPQAVG
jgi:hypothetical protein